MELKKKFLKGLNDVNEGNISLQVFADWFESEELKDLITWGQSFGHIDGLEYSSPSVTGDVVIDGKRPRLTMNGKVYLKNLETSYSTIKQSYRKY